MWQESKIKLLQWKMEGNGFYIHLPMLASCQRAFIGKPQLEPGTLVGRKAVFFLLEAYCLL